MTRPAYIYALAEPDTGDVRYVGKTVNLKYRYGGHLKDKTETRRGRWIRSLARDEKVPVLFVLEIADDWREAERRWIAAYRVEGADLTNHTDGGDGVSGLDAEGRAKISAIQKALWADPAHRAKVLTPARAAAISRALAGKPKTPSHVAKLWQNQPGWNHKEETKALIAEASRGRKHSPETIELLRELNRGNQYGLGNRSRTGQDVPIAERRKKSQTEQRRPKTSEHAAAISVGLRNSWANGLRTGHPWRLIEWPPFVEIEALLSLYTIKEVARRLDVKPGTLSAHVHRHRNGYVSTRKEGASI